MYIHILKGYSYLPTLDFSGIYKYQCLSQCLSQLGKIVSLMYHMALIRLITHYTSQNVSAHGIEFMFQSFFENVKFCIVNVETVCVSKQCPIFIPCPKCIMYIYKWNDFLSLFKQCCIVLKYFAKFNKILYSLFSRSTCCCLKANKIIFSTAL